MRCGSSSDDCFTFPSNAVGNYITAIVSMQFLPPWPLASFIIRVTDWRRLLYATDDYFQHAMPIDHIFSDSNIAFLHPIRLCLLFAVAFIIIVIILPFTMFVFCYNQHSRERNGQPSMSVLLIVGPKCTLTASHATIWWVAVTKLADGRTNGWTPDRCIKLSAVDAASVIIDLSK